MVIYDRALENHYDTKIEYAINNLNLSLKKVGSKMECYLKTIDIHKNDQKIIIKDYLPRTSPSISESPPDICDILNKRKYDEAVKCFYVNGNCCYISQPIEEADGTKYLLALPKDNFSPTRYYFKSEIHKIVEPTPGCLEDAIVYRNLVRIRKMFPMRFDAKDHSLFRMDSLNSEAAADLLSFCVFLSNSSGIPEQKTPLPLYAFAVNEYQSINNMSSLNYEGKENTGKLLFISSNDLQKCEMIINFKNNISLIDDAKMSRKCFELADDDSYVICSSGNIVGIGKINGNEDRVFTISFMGHNKWKLNCDGLDIMLVNNQIPHLPFDYEQDLLEAAKGLAITEDKISIISNFIGGCLSSHHGSILIVTPAAQSESERLQSRMLIQKTTVDGDLAKKLSYIDGAIIVDPELNTYAIGIILDGICTIDEDPSRGSRYNSTKRYINYLRTRTGHEAIAIIVSEDGYVNIVGSSHVSEKLQKKRFS